MKKSRIGIAVASLLLTLLLVGCGGSQEAPSAEPAAEPEAIEEATTEEKTPLDSQALLDAVFAVCPIDLSQMDNIKVGAEHDGKVEVTFDSAAGPFSYTLDAYTGEILDKTEPEVSAEVKAADPTEEAINACFDSLDGYNGGAENIKVKFVESDGAQKIEVEFDWNGEHHDMLYDPATGTIG
ncbi:MAG: hypothetical protein IJ781_09310 [Atopobiaceae bacterium]|nr:hypothetical protein [Atopobiaceae bacterium]